MDFPSSVDFHAQNVFIVIILLGQYTYYSHALALLYIRCVYPGADSKVFNPRLIHIVFHIARLLSFSEYKLKVIVICILGLSIAPVKTRNSCYK